MINFNLWKNITIISLFIQARLRLHLDYDYKFCIWLWLHLDYDYKFSVWLRLQNYSITVTVWLHYIHLSACWFLFCLKWIWKKAVVVTLISKLYSRKFLQLILLRLQNNFDHSLSVKQTSSRLHKTLIDYD